MITAFSMRANGWVNFRVPNAPTPATITRGRAIAFPMMDANTVKGTGSSNVPAGWPSAEPFAYATKQAAETFNIDQPATPREWAKVIPVYPGQDE